MNAAPKGKIGRLPGAIRELSGNVHPDKIKAGAEAIDASLCKNFANVFVAEYAVTCRAMLNQPEDPGQRLERIRKMLRTLNQERRSEPLADRLKFEEERLDFHQLPELDLPLPGSPEPNMSSSSELR